MATDCEWKEALYQSIDKAIVEHVQNMFYAYKQLLYIIANLSFILEY